MFTFRGEVTELAEGARLEIVCALTRHREFESPPLRHFFILHTPTKHNPFQNQIDKLGLILQLSTSDCGHTP